METPGSRLSHLTQLLLDSLEERPTRVVKHISVGEVEIYDVDADRLLFTLQENEDGVRVHLGFQRVPAAWCAAAQLLEDNGVEVCA